MPDYSDFPDQPDTDYSDFPDQPNKSVTNSITDKIKSGFDWMLSPLAPEAETTGHRVIGGQEYGIPDPTDIDTYKGLYNEVIRPFTAPIGLLGLGAEKATRFFRGPKQSPIKPSNIPSAIEQPVIEKPTTLTKPRYRVTPEGLREVKPEEAWIKTFPDQVVTKEPVVNKTGIVYKDGKYQKVGAEPEPIKPVEELVKPQDLAKKLLTEEEGSFDPTAVTRKIRKALDDAEEYHGYIPEPTSNTQSAVGKLFAAIQDAKETSILNEELLSYQRGERASKFAKVRGRGIERAKNAMSTLKGKYERVEGNPLKLDDTDIGGLYDVITDSTLRPFEQARSYTALSKLLTGEAPQRNELALLDRVYGRGFSNSIIDLHGGLGGPISQKVITETANFSRAIKTAFDASAPFRQGLNLIDRSEWWKAFFDMGKGLGREEAYQSTMDSIYSKELFKPSIKLKGKNSLLSLADIADLKMTKLDSHINNEEGFMSRLAEQIPGVKHSERAFMGFVNKLRADIFESLVNDAENQGRNPRQDFVLLKEIGAFVNNSTGRGSLGKLERYAIPLNNALFSPRLIASRFAYLNPQTYIKADPFVRKQYIRGLGAMLGTGATVLGLTHLMGAEVSTDSNNSDFLKAKFGNARLDPWGGYQQYAVLLSRIVNEIKENYVDGKKPAFGSTPALPKFVYYKLSPASSAALRYIYGRDPVSGQKLSFPDEMQRNIEPMFIQDTIDLLSTEPKAFPIIPLSFFGMGSQTYEPSQLKQQLRLPPMK